MTYTAVDIITEGFKRAGRCITQHEKARAETILTDIKHAIWLKRTVLGITQLRSLAADCFMLTKVGMSRYQLPDDFNEEGTLHLLYGARQITIDDVTLPKQVICAGSADLTADDVGRRIVWRNGPAEAYSQEIVALNLNTDWTLTLEAEFEDGETAAPGNGFTIIDRVDKLDQVSHDEVDDYNIIHRVGRPQEFFIHSERLQLDRPCDEEYILRLRYYVDITKVPAGSKIDDQINRRWYSVLVKGAYWVAALEIGDTVARDAYAQLERAIQDLVWQDQDRGADDSRFGFIPWR